MTVIEEYDFRAVPNFAVSVDVVVFTIEEDQLMVALIDRAEATDRRSLSLPGGFLRHGETLMEAAFRELQRDTGVEIPSLAQLGAYGQPDTDAMPLVSIGYWAIVPDLSESAGTPATGTLILPVDEVLQANTELHPDHELIIGEALEQARLALESTTVATEFCGEEFTITELRNVYEIVWGVRLDQGNFQNKVLEIEDFLVPTGNHRTGGRGRPPELFTAGDALMIDPPFRRPRTEDRKKMPKWEETPKPSMGFSGYVDRVGFHFDRLGVTERPTQQQYLDAWNNQIPAGKLASTFARRIRRQVGHKPEE